MQPAGWGASHFTSGESRCCTFLGAGAAFPRCHCFRFHLREASLTPPHLFSFCFALNPLRYVEFGRSEVWGEFKSFPAMGDIEAPESSRPRQTVLMSVLPSKEFATSRKGMLLIGEVVRNDQRNLNQMKLLLCHCSAWCARKSKRAAFWRLLFAVFR